MNVILIISDTVRYDYCGFNNAAWVHTPHLDALARESVVFDGYYTASFPTGPMRKDTHSGRFTFPYTNWGGERPEEEALLGEILHQKGIRTAFIGDTGNSKQYLYGFDHLEIVPGESSGVSDVPETVDLPAPLEKLRKPMAWAQRIARNSMGWQGESDRRCARTMLAAHRWLEGLHGKTKPFFLWVDTFDPHEPWDPPEYYVDLYDKGYDGDKLIEPAYEPAGYADDREVLHMRRRYAAKLTMVDRWIGHLLDGLRTMGRLDDTAILFTTDHGFYHGEHGFIGKVQLDPENTVCRRWPLYATITHAPLMMRIPAGPRGRHNAFVQPPDLAPTILDLFGSQPHQRMQGQSLLPLVHGEKTSLRDAAVSSLTYITDDEVRCPTAFRTKEHLYIYGGDEWESELYDLKKDPSENHNVIREQESVAKELHGRYIDFLRQIECPESSLKLREPFGPEPREKLPHKRLM